MPHLQSQGRKLSCNVLARGAKEMYQNHPYHHTHTSTLTGFLYCMIEVHRYYVWDGARKISELEICSALQRFVYTYNLNIIICNATQKSISNWIECDINYIELTYFWEFFLQLYFYHLHFCRFFPKKRNFIFLSTKSIFRE